MNWTRWRKVLIFTFKKRYRSRVAIESKFKHQINKKKFKEIIRPLSHTNSFTRSYNWKSYNKTKPNIQNLATTKPSKVHDSHKMPNKVHTTAHTKTFSQEKSQKRNTHIRAKRILFSRAIIRKFGSVTSERLYCLKNNFIIRKSETKIRCPDNKKRRRSPVAQSVKTRSAPAWGDA